MPRAKFNVASESRYNDLSDVFDADYYVRCEDRLDRFLEFVAPLFHNHRMSTSLGVGLLHKHNDLEKDCVMFQSEGIFKGDPALLCRPKNRSFINDVAAPILYDVANDNSLVGLEFSGDLLVRENAKQLGGDRKFLADFSTTRRKFGVEKYLGLSALCRNFFLESDDPELIQIEESDVDDIGNVIRLRRKGEIDTHGMIQTAWAFTEVTGAQCVPLCSRGCFPRSPGHSTEHYPNHGLIA